MKLELKHLAPYLNNKIWFKLFNGKKLLCKGIYNIKGMWYLKATGGVYCIEDCKPILRPLSDFKEMIIRDIRLFLELSHNQTMEFLGFSDGEIQLQNISLGLHDAMCQKHVDFNKLIEKGLAIDINTIKL